MSGATIAHPVGDARPGGHGSGQIDRRSGLTPRDFARDYLDPLKPVIVTDAFEHWRAARKWTPGFFREAYGSRSVTVEEFSTRCPAFSTDERSNAAAPAPYLRNVAIAVGAGTAGGHQPLPVQIGPTGGPLFRAAVADIAGAHIGGPRVIPTLRSITCTPHVRPALARNTSILRQYPLPAAGHRSEQVLHRRPRSSRPGAVSAIRARRAREVRVATRRDAVCPVGLVAHGADPRTEHYRVGEHGEQGQLGGIRG
jgi:hypothetical protein